MKKTLLLLTTILLSAGLFAQTTLIDPAGDGGFENGATFAANGWTVVNYAATTNSNWYITSSTLTNGGYTFTPTGANAAYISNNNGTNWRYTTLPVISTVHFYRDITFPAGETVIPLSFTWNASGESTWDIMYVYLCPTTLTPVTGSPSSSSSTPTWSGTGTATLLGSYNLLTAGGGISSNLVIPSSVAGNGSSSSTMRLVFTWKNDGSLGTDPPAAIDYISLTSRAPSPLSGTYTINNTLPTSSPMVPGGNFASFTDAIRYLNGDGIAGAVTFNVTAGQTFTEDPPAILATGTASNTITFQRSGAGDNPVIKPTGGSGSSDAGITIQGGDYFTFDGIDISINTGSAVEFGYYIRNASALDGAQNNTIKNTKITLNRSNTSSRGIYQNVATTPTNATGANSGNLYYNLTIENVYYGIYLLGNATYNDTGCEIGTEAGGVTTIGAATANDIGNGSSAAYGIRATQQSNLKVFSTEVRNVTVTSSVSPMGIYIENGRGTGYIYNNNIHDIKTTSTSTSSVIYGIRADFASGHTGYVYNNFVSGFSHGITTASSTMVARGLAAHVNASTGTVYFLYNSVRIELQAAATCAALYSQSGTVHAVNNILSNFSAGGATAKKFCIYISSGTLGTSNYNDFFIQTGTNKFVGYYSAADRATLANWQTATSKDGNSKNADPSFISSTNLHSESPDLYNAGTPIATPTFPIDITTDIDGAARSATTPSIGADEFVLVPVLTVSPSTLALGYAEPGGTSPEQTYALSGTSLAGAPDNIVVTAPSGFEVSLTSGSGFAGTVNVPFSGPTLAPTDIYVRFVPTGAPAAYSGNVTNEGGSATAKNVAVTGTSHLINKYCTSAATSTSYVDITNVTMSDLNNASTCSTTGGYGSIQNRYSNYTETVTPPSLAQNTEIMFNVTISNCGTTNSNNAIKIFIDYDQDGDLTDPDEEVFVSAAPALGGHLETGAFTVPNTALTGTTFMRIVNVQTSTPSSITPCGTYTYGETEDYAVTITTEPTCLPPSGLSASNVQATTADLDWTENGSASEWQIQYGPQGFVLGTGTTINTTSNPHPLTGLTSASAYSAYVRAWCSSSEQSPWYGPVHFMTTCDPAGYPVPLTENFDGVTAPSVPICWTVTNDNGDAYLWETTTTSPRSAPNAMRIRWNTSLAMNDWFFSKPLSLTGGVTYRVSFYYRAGSSSWSEKLEVRWGDAPDAAGMTGGQIFDNPGFNFSTYTEGYGTFTPPSTGVYYIGWHGYSDADKYYIYVDDIVIDRDPLATTGTTTTSPTNLTLNGTLTGYSFSLTSSFDWGLTNAYGNNVAATPSPVTGASTPISASITGFPLNTTIYYRAKGMLGAEAYYGTDESAVWCPVPNDAGPITGTAEICQSTNGIIFSVNPILNATSYVWTVPAGAAIVNGQGTAIVVVNFGAIAVSGNVSVYGANVCGNGNPSSFAVTLYPRPVPVITKSGTECIGETVTYTTEAGMTNYLWTYPLNATLIAGGGTSDHSVTIKYLFSGDYSIGVNYTTPDGCNALAGTTRSVHIYGYPSILGPASICLQGATYRTETGMTNYQWGVSAGVNIVAGGGTGDDYITVSFASNGLKTISLNYTNPFGCTAPSATTLNVTVGAQTPPVITGPTTVQQNQTVQYSVPFVPGNSYSWNVLPGWVSYCSENRACINVTWTDPCGIVSPGTVTVYETIWNSSCTVSSTVSVTITP